MIIRIVVFAALLVCAAGTFGQTKDAVALKRSKMAILEQLAGNWRGSGWVQIGQVREEFSGTELVQKKLDGLALLVEGRFTNKEGKVGHETLAVLNYDDAAKVYKFSTFLANGITGVQDLKIVGDHYEWGFEMRTGTVRYSIRIDADKWNEIGEFPVMAKRGKKLLK